MSLVEDVLHVVFSQVRNLQFVTMLCEMHNYV